MTERAITFDCAGERLVGVISESPARAPFGLIVVVGGPQYRVGSHRQFLLLARRFAESGIPVLRFDYRGMGDSSGDMRNFEDVTPDIAAAIDAFRAAASVERVVLWGLCDAASAILLYWQTKRDPRVIGMVLLNPWIRSEATLALTHVKHYYGRRLFAREFWGNLIRGKVDVAATLRELIGTLKLASSREHAAADGNAAFQDRMEAALRTFPGPVLLVLSGDDLTAKEFLEYSRVKDRWRGVLDRSDIERCTLAGADHTFSTAIWRDQVEALTLSWCNRHFKQKQP